MFRSGLTKEIYENFLRSYQLNRSELDYLPFVYVNLQSLEIKFLTSLTSSNEIGSDIYAVSIEPGGKLELLSTGNS